MSTEKVEQIHLRIRAELERLSLSLAEASRRAGEKSPQRLKDVISGKQRCPIDLLVSLRALGVDLDYVATGERAASLTVEESGLLEAFRAAPDAVRKAALAALLSGRTADTSISIKGGVGQVIRGDVTFSGGVHVGGKKK